MQTQIEINYLEQTRTKWLIINLIGFFIWDGIRILNNYFFQEGVKLLIIAEIIGWLMWVVGLIGTLRISRQIKRDESVSQAINDEYFVLNRLRAWKIGFIILIITQMVVLLVSQFVKVTGPLSAEISIFTGVTAAILSFLIYHR